MLAIKAAQSEGGSTGLMTLGEFMGPRRLAAGGAVNTTSAAPVLVEAKATNAPAGVAAPHLNHTSESRCRPC